MDTVSNFTILVAFARSYQLTNALSAMQKMHLMPSVARVYSKEDVQKINAGKQVFLETDTLMLELHGIADIIKLEALYIESICQEHGSLTFDTYKKSPLIS